MIYKPAFHVLGPFQAAMLRALPVLAAAFCLLGCQSSVRVIPGTAENVHEHHSLTYTKAAEPATGKVWYLHVQHPGEPCEPNPSHPAPVPDALPVPSPADHR